MAEETLLQMVQGVCQRIGLAMPSVVATSTDQTVLQFLGIANAEVEDQVRRELNFSAFIEPNYTFTYVTNANWQALDLSLTPADFRSVVAQTFWNRTLRLPVWGPVSPNQWAQMIAMGVSSAVDNYRVAGKWILIYPGPSVLQTYGFDYYSKFPVRDAGGVSKASFTADTDTPKLPSAIVKKGIEWRWRQVKGQPYAQEQQDYEGMINNYVGRDTIPATLDMANPPNSRVAGPGLLIAAGSWPLP